MLDDDQSFPDGISSPIAAHILDFCDDGNGGGDLFAAASDVFAASSEDASSSSTTATPHVCGDNMSSSGAVAANSFSPLPSLDSTLSALLEDDQPPGPDAELLLPIEYTFVATADDAQPEQQQFGQMALPVAEHHPTLQTQMSSTASELMQFASGYTDECLAAALAGGFMGMDEATLCNQQQPGGGMLPAAVGDAASQGCYAAARGGFFGGSGCAGTVMSMMLGMEQIGEYQRMMDGAGALVDADSSAQMVFPAASEMQMGSGSPGQLPPSATVAESSSLEDTSFKAARLSVEERKEKIHRYIKKRNERNFSKKIKYACRKTLADSRPRVRGRFAKNDEYCESSRLIGSQNHEEYDQMSGVKGEDMLDPEALAHISGMSSYMYNHTVESWI
uniref:Uncharacterized protein n=1 Tax=Avena sativa TaxID=4498 RepID=A0ACD5TPB0_AVESA